MTGWADAIGWVDTATPAHILIFRLVLASILGGLIGFERELHRRAAGLRTHILIALASAVFTIMSFEIYSLVRASGVSSPGDLLRVVPAVTAGVAFLGAGAIFRSDGIVRGLTTGAGMWLAGAVGIAAASGYYLIAACASILAVLVLAVLGAIEERFKLGRHGGTGK